MAVEVVRGMRKKKVHRALALNAHFYVLISTQLHTFLSRCIWMTGVGGVFVLMFSDMGTGCSVVR